MINVQYNIGTFIGLNGTAVIYSAITGTTKILIYKIIVGEGETAVEKWVFMPKSAFSTHMAGQNATITSSEDLSTFAEVLPAGLADGSGNLTIENEPTPVLPRIYNNQGFYSLAGANVVAYTGERGTAKTGTSDGSTVVITTNSSAKTATEMLSDAVAWGTKNWILVLVAILLLLEVFGVTGFILPKKKKAPVRRRR